jgi:hypothetical protein
VAAVSADTAARKRDYACGQRGRNDGIDRVATRGKDFYARFVGMWVADDDAANIAKRRGTKGAAGGKSGNGSASDSEK